MEFLNKIHRAQSGGTVVQEEYLLWDWQREREREREREINVIKNIKIIITARWF